MTLRCREPFSCHADNNFIENLDAWHYEAATWQNNSVSAGCQPAAGHAGNPWSNFLGVHDSRVALQSLQWTNEKCFSPCRTLRFKLPLLQARCPHILHRSYLDRRAESSSALKDQSLIDWMNTMFVGVVQKKEDEVIKCL